MRIVWIPFAASSRFASIRLRCLIPAAQLRVRGHDVQIDDSPEIRGHYDVAVFSKRYDSSAADLAARLTARGTRVLLDLCDNHFYSTYENAASRNRRESLVKMIRIVDGVVASSHALAGVVREHVHDAPPIAVIEDPIEDLHGLESDAPFRDWLRVPSWFKWRSEILQRRRRGECGLVWFGNHGVDYSNVGGMGDLSKLKDILHELAREHSFHVSVISNHREKFRTLTKGWGIPCLYLDWTARTFGRSLGLHDIALIPIERNPFTVCKTANRVVTSLQAGVAVAADSIPSYAPFSGFVVLDDWFNGLARYLRDSSLRSRHVEEGRGRIQELFTPLRIADRWESVLLGVLREKIGATAVQVCGRHDVQLRVAAHEQLGNREGK